MEAKIKLWKIQDGEIHHLFGETKEDAHKEYLRFWVEGAGVDECELAPIEDVEQVDDDQPVRVSYFDGAFTKGGKVEMSASDWCWLFENIDQYENCDMKDGGLMVQGHLINPVAVICMRRKEPYLCCSVW